MLAVGFEQALGQHQVAQAHAGREDLGERSRIDDPVGLVNRLKRGDGHLTVTILAVVIVFDDKGIVGLRPLDQAPAA